VCQYDFGVGADGHDFPTLFAGEIHCCHYHLPRNALPLEAVKHLRMANNRTKSTPKVCTQHNLSNERKDYLKRQYPNT